MNEEMLLAVQDSARWLDLFERRTYRKAFRRYQEQFAQQYQEMLRICTDEAMLQSAADWLLTELERGWKRQRFWNRTAARLDQKQMIIVYLSPMLLAMEDPAGARFAQVLRDSCEARWPKDSYQMEPFEKLVNGFHHAILGIELSAFNREEEDDE